MSSPAHNPVTFTCGFGEKIYKFTTYNYGSGNDKEPEGFDRTESVRLKMDDCKRSDIVFCQEFTNGRMTSFNEHHRYFGHKVNNGYTALLIKKKTFPEERKQFPESRVDFCLPANHLGRHCTVKLDDIIVISWHGKFKSDKPNKEEDKDAAKNWKIFYLTTFLEQHAFSLVKQYGLPIIIGGDFNLQAKDVEAAVEKLEPPPNCWHFIHKPNNPRQRSYDYFYILIPSFKCTEAIAQPPQYIFKEANVRSLSCQQDCIETETAPRDIEKMTKHFQDL